MSYADDLLDNRPAPQREGFTNYKHWRVVQTGDGGTTNWFATRSDAGRFQSEYGGIVTGVSCEEFDSAWPEDWREPHIHGTGSVGERLGTPEPTPQSDARRSQRRGRLV